MNTQEQELDALVRASLVADGFRPFAVFDELLDCIRVVKEDRSVNEVRVNEWLTIHEANFPDDGTPDIVGFTIKGIAHLCESCGINATEPWMLADFLDAVVKSSAPSVRLMVDQIVRPILVDESDLRQVDRQVAA